MRKKMLETVRDVKGERRISRRTRNRSRGLTTEFTEDAEKADQRRKWEISHRTRVRPTLRAMDVVIGK
jgi:hypothetical protein